MNIDWDGKGLPPVGCEVLTVDLGRTFKVRILSYAKKAGKTAVMVEDTESGTNEGELHAWMAHMCGFLPVPSPEHIAAEQHRQSYMTRLIKLWDDDTSRAEFLEAVYAMIVEASKK